MNKTIVLILSMMLIFMGCSTKELWQEKTKKVPYDEIIVALMINPENKSLVFIGEKYHYIFNKNEKFSYLYENKNESITFDSTNGIYYTKNDEVSAYFSIYLYTKNLKQEVIDWALENGGRYVKYENEKIHMRINLKGKRYLANEEVNKIAEKLSTQHKIKINDIIPDDYSTASKIALTPLSVSGDLIIVSAGVIGITLAFITMCTLPGIFGNASSGCK